MRHKTFLELCNVLAREVGVPGNFPLVDTVNQKGELLDIASYIDQANTKIVNDWNDWRFMWGEAVFKIAPKSYVISKDTHELMGCVSRFDLNSFIAEDQYGQGKVRHISWQQMRFDRHQRESGFPDCFAQHPNGEIHLSPTPDTEVTISANCYFLPTPLVEKDDTPNIPPEFWKLVVERAKLIYSGAEDAPEIGFSGSIEYESDYASLKSKYLVSHQESHTSNVENPEDHVIRVM